jgi:hypothetical protein
LLLTAGLRSPCQRHPPEPKSSCRGDQEEAEEGEEAVNCLFVIVLPEEMNIVRSWVLLVDPL